MTFKRFKHRAGTILGWIVTMVIISGIYGIIMSTKGVIEHQSEDVKTIIATFEQEELELVEVNKMARITCYTDKGIMANGNYTRPGAVAFSDRSVPLNQAIYVSGFGEMFITDRTAKWVHEKYDVPTIDVWMTEEECEKFGLKYDTYKIIK